jgi:rhodanese-related sulfurtransferase
MKANGITLLLAIAFLMTGCTQAQSDYKLDAAAFEAGIKKADVQVLDVRTAAEFRTGYIKKALHADWNDSRQFSERTQHLDKNKPVYVYCLSGVRSASAANWLRKSGFALVYELKGGLISWKNSSKPIEGSSVRKQMTIAEYEALTKSHAVVLVDFGAEWCPPCKKMEPILHEIQKEKAGQFILVKVDGGIDTDVLKSQSVDALPVFVVYKNGKEVWRKQGIVSKEELLQHL